MSFPAFLDTNVLYGALINECLLDQLDLDRDAMLGALFELVQRCDSPMMTLQISRRSNGP